MKLILASVASLILLSSCAYQSGMLEKQDSSPVAADNTQQTIETPAPAAIAPHTQSPSSVAAKMISPVTR